MKKLLLMMFILTFIFGSYLYLSANNGPDFDGCCCHSTLYTTRYGGADRIETAIEVSNAAFEFGVGPGPASIAKTISGGPVLNRKVVICRSDEWPDALAAAGLAGYYGIPILLNPTAQLDERVEDELERLFGDVEEDDEIIVIGGTGAISENVVDDLEDLGFDVDRIGGANRYETAALIADEINDLYGNGGVDTIIIATGENWPDALAVSPWAYYTASWIYAQPIDEWYGRNDPWPIILVQRDDIPGYSLDWLLSNKDVDCYVIGGTGVVGSDVMQDLGYYLEGDIERVAGDNRYETCIEIAEHEDFWDIQSTDDPNRQHFIFATGNNFPDALASSQLLGCWKMVFKTDEVRPINAEFVGAPLILTSSLDDSIEDYFDDLFEGASPHDPEDNDLTNKGDSGHGIVVGGMAAVDKETEDDIAEALSDGDFEPTDDPPEIKEFTAEVWDAGNGGNIPEVAEWNYTDEIDFDVTTDEHIWNEDGTVGKVVIEDISEMGGNEAPYDEDDFELILGGVDGDDFYWEREQRVEKKHTSPEERSVTFTAKATNQAGSDTETSSSVDIYN